MSDDLIEGVRQRRARRASAPTRRAIAIPSTRAAALALAGLVLAGCSGPSAEAGATPVRPSIGPAPTGITSPSQVTRPIDGYFLRPDQVAATEFARIRLAGTCLAGKGYASAGMKAEPGTAEALAIGVAARVRDADLYGFFDTLDNARAYGYQDPPGMSGGSGVSWSPDVPQAVSDDCFAEAAKSIGFDDVMDLVLPKKLPDGGPVVPSGDPAYVAAVVAWSACMSEHGYTYSDPHAARGDARWRDDRVADKASGAQIATAMADVQCKISTNLIGVAMAVQTAYDQQYIDAHTDQLAAYRERLQRAVAGTGATGSSS